MNNISLSDALTLMGVGLTILTPIYWTLFKIRSDFSDMKSNVAVLRTTIELCPNCPHQD